MTVRRPLAAVLVIAIAITAGVGGGTPVARATATEDVRDGDACANRAPSERARKATGTRGVAAVSLARHHLDLCRLDLDLDHARPWTAVRTTLRFRAQPAASAPRPRSRAPPRA